MTYSNLPLPQLNDYARGDLISLEMPFPGVFHMEYALTDPFYAVSPAYSGRELSPMALTFGVEVDGWRVFDVASGYYVIHYEVLRDKCKYPRSRNERAYLADTMAEIALLWQDEYPDYFGEGPAPDCTPAGPGGRYRRVASGIYFIEGGGEWFLSVTASLTGALSQETNDVGTRYPLGGDTSGMTALLFDRKQCALPILDLWDSHSEAFAPYLVSQEALYAALRRNYPAYISRYNAEQQKSYQACGSLSFLTSQVPEGPSSGEDFLCLPL